MIPVSQAACMTGESYFIAGGAGFIGSNLVEYLLWRSTAERITVYDNFTSGSRDNLPACSDSRLQVIEGDLHDQTYLRTCLPGHAIVVHLASNPDISRAVVDPSVDFYEGTVLTHNLVEAMRQSGCKTILYASGSGVYGDKGELSVTETHGPAIPISTYGASKLAGEALVAAYCHMFGFTGRVFRFANVVGPRQTHGVTFDLVNKLIVRPQELTVLGDGKQSKSYLYVGDAINAMIMALHSETGSPFEVYNVATGDYLTVAEIVLLAQEMVVGRDDRINVKYAGGSRGWAGDIPVVRLNTDKIRRLGWQCQYNSRQSIEMSIKALLQRWHGPA